MDIAAQSDRRNRVYRIHREAYRDQFSRDPDFTNVGSEEDRTIRSREILCHGLAFLAGDEHDIRLANTLIRGTPKVNNHFNPIIAAEILLRYQDVLEPSTKEALTAIINDGLPEAIDASLAVTGVHNFSMMRAFLFMAASQLLETYRVSYELHSIPEVYNRMRLRRFGMNVLRLLELQLERTDLCNEFNSPTYSPISLWAAAEIVNLIDYPPACEAARRIEGRLWRELLAFHHPLLKQLSGPYSRAYTVDMVGHASSWKLLCGFLGLDGDVSVAELLYPPAPGQIIHCGDLAFQRCMACWSIRADYHPPEDALTEFNRREYPYTYSGSYEVHGQGFKRSNGKVVLNVEGDFMQQDGRGVASCYQSEVFSVGTMTEPVYRQSCQIIYQLSDTTRPLGGTRSITTAMFTRDPFGGGNDVVGDDELPHFLPNNGRFEISHNGPEIEGSVKPEHWAPYCDSAAGCDEISLNFLISEHLPLNTPVEMICLDSRPYDGGTLRTRAKEATFVLIDGAVKVTWAVTSCEDTEFCVLRQKGFLRCAAIMHRGDPVMFTPDELDRMRLTFSIRVEER